MTQTVESMQAELAQVKRERDTGLLREAAMADIAQRINESPLDLDGTLIALCEAARDLTHGDAARVWLLEGERLIAGPGAGGDALHVVEEFGAFFPLSSPSPLAAAVRERKGMSIEDMQAAIIAPLAPGDAATQERLVELLRGIGVRSLICAPLGRITPLGGLAVYRREVRPFTSTELSTLEAFATQAAVAIETARAQQQLAAQNDALTRGLERETATAGILRSISQHPGELEKVLAEIGSAAMRLCETEYAAIGFIGPEHSSYPFTWIWDNVNGLIQRPPDAESVSTDPSTDPFLVVSGRLSELEDRYPSSVRRARAVGLQEAAFMRVRMGVADGTQGWMVVRRSTARAFDSRHFPLLQGFADQALVAIDNARVFNELKARNAEISAALEREQATSEVLDVINRSQADLQPVLDRIALLAARLTNSTGMIVLATPTHLASVTPWGNGGRTGAASLAAPVVLPNHGSAPATLTDTRGSATSVAIRDGITIHLHGGVDVFETAWPGTAAGWRPSNFQSGVIVPLVLKDVHWGAIHVARTTKDPYAPEQIALLETFAAQAAIAIENSRLLAELHQRNSEISEALEQQKALSDVLNVIANSATDAKPVLSAILETGSKLCLADGASAFLVHGDNLAMEAATGLLESLVDDARASWPIDDSTAVGKSIGERRTVFIETYADRERSMRSALLVEAFGVRSTIAVPLLRGDKALGALGFVRMAETPFTPQQVALIETFADQAVIAIENARLFNELKTRNQEITEALRREEAGSAILRQISRTPEQLDETLQAITDAARNLTGNSSNLSLIDGEFRIIRAQSKLDRVPTLEVGQRMPLSKALLEVVLTRRTLVWSCTESIDPEPWWREDGLRAVVVTPICHGEVVIGLLGLASITVDHIPAANVNLLQSYADQAAIAIQNANLIRELRESNRVVNENLDMQRVMSEVLAIVASAPTNLHATLPAIAEAAAKLCDATSAAVGWIEDGNLFTFNGVDVLTTPIDPDWVRTSFVASVATRGEPIEFHGEFSEYASNWAYSAQLLARLREVNGVSNEAQHSSLGVPMRGRVGAMGALCIGHLAGGRFTPRHVAVMESLATQAVVAIENSRLFNQLQAKTQELEVASRHKSEFLANMSHELRTPLNAIIGYAELLQEEFEDLGQQEFLPDLGKIHSAGKHLLTLISGILDLSKVEAGRMTMFLEDFDIPTLIRDADAIVRPLVEKNRNSFVIDCPDDVGMMHADLVKVRQVLFNLLSNSAKFTEGGTITLTVRKPVAEATVTLAIRDTGIGMSDEQLSRLFEAFSQATAETSRKYGGTGLGLALSREFCRMMGGDITVESALSAGSTFTVTLPVSVVDGDGDGGTGETS